MLGVVCFSFSLMKSLGWSAILSDRDGSCVAVKSQHSKYVHETVLNSADYMLKKRERARFPTNRIQVNKTVSYKILKYFN